MAYPFLPAPSPDGGSSTRVREHRQGGRTPSRRWAALHAWFAMSLAACGGGGGDEGPSATPPPSPAPLPAPSPLPPPPPASNVPPRAAPAPLADGTDIGTQRWPAGNTASGGQGEPVQGLNCGLMGTAYHVHAHLSIFLNGEMLRIPADVGIVPRTDTRNQCTYPMHTHDGTGKIHVEGPVPRRFTLGQFFAIWGQPLGPDNVAGLTGWTVVAYVSDGDTVTQYTGDLAEIDLTSHREVTLQLGSPIDAVPNYTWPGD